MPIVPPLPVAVVPTNFAPLSCLLSYTRALGLERHPARPERDGLALTLALVWLTLAWHDNGQPSRGGG